ncbi:oligosaccharide biosynthesis protein Alg14 like-domain-containing protein [Diplogelasinospora grovesii]|uniref:UDP-N-acetylglucosamine transferase subunit ALG14 n=1 Tax=Diplogelasinospora grovesii TaxID=303347 RepID=A0AAN6S602_9PEZI|nr:oligosaccharide biosynthesis protein Alg14 like-domain-containing protein [Diplogelasinospora grovesii]
MAPNLLPGGKKGTTDIPEPASVSGDGALPSPPPTGPESAQNATTSDGLSHPAGVEISSNINSFILPLLWLSVFTAAGLYLLFSRVSFVLAISGITSAVAVLGSSVVYRHITLIRSQPPTSIFSLPPTTTTTNNNNNNRSPGVSRVPDTSTLPAVYLLYVLGSGGHTTEMLATIRQSFRPQANVHRRYIVTSGDTYSRTAVQQLEAQIAEACPGGEGGTYDIFRATRARRVHQSLYTAPFTALVSALCVIDALRSGPIGRGEGFGYPHVITTNGPGSGFVVCLVAHVMKMLGMMTPGDRGRVVFIETWAHTNTLSLTGKLFWWSGIADLFCVQHEQLARKTGKKLVDLGLTKNARVY